MAKDFLDLTDARTAKRLRLPLSRLQGFESRGAGAVVNLTRGRPVEVMESPAILHRLIAAPGIGRTVETTGFDKAPPGV